MFNLATDPWIPALTPEGATTLSLADAFRQADRVHVAGTGYLEEHALIRLALAVTYAAYGADARSHTYAAPVDTRRVSAWLCENAHHFELFDPERPFMQDITMLQTDPLLPIWLADLTAAKDRPLISDHRYEDTGETLSFADAALTLITLQVFAPYGRSQGVSTSMSSGIMGRFLARFTGTFAHALRWMFVPSKYVGEPQWTFTPSTASMPGSEAQGYAWMMRRMLFETDGERVTGYRLNQGWRMDKTRTGDDTAPGRHDVAPFGPRNLNEEEGTIYDSGSALVMAKDVRRASPESILGHLIAYLDAHPDVPAPRLHLMGIENNQALHHEVQCVTVADPRLNPTKNSINDHARSLREAGLPVSMSQTVLATGEMTPYASDVIEWPVWNSHLYARRAEVETDREMSVEERTLARLLAQPVSADDAGEEAARADLLTVMEILSDSERRDPLAHAASVRALTSADIPTSETVAFIAGLLAQAHTRVFDTPVPLPKRMKMLMARTGSFDRIRELFTAVVETTDPRAARAELAEIVRLCAHYRVSFSLLSLAHDIENWSTSIACAWMTAMSADDTPAETTDTH